MSDPEDGGAPNLSERIKAAKAAREDKPDESGTAKYAALSLAWRMVVELLAGTGIGFAMGWGLDDLFGTKPWLMVVFGLLGFAAGAKTAISSAMSVANSSGDHGAMRKK